jgi:hypothetical protein
MLSHRHPNHVVAYACAGLVPSGTGLIVDKSDIVSATTTVRVAVPDEVFFAHDSVGVDHLSGPLIMPKVHRSPVGTSSNR